MNTKIKVLSVKTNSNQRTGEVFSYLVSYLDDAEIGQLNVREGLDASLVDLPFSGKPVTCDCEFSLKSRKDKGGYSLMSFEVVSLVPVKTQAA